MWSSSWMSAAACWPRTWRRSTRTRRTELRNLADYLERAGGYRIGLISFAERSAVLCPLTSDYRCFAEELAAASLKSLRLRGHAAWGDGTRISTALDRAGKSIDDDNAAYTDVLLVSDGGDMARETLEAADALARRGITVHTLGLGDSAHGSLIPVRDRLGRPAHLRYRGELVSTQLQEEVLQAIAEHPTDAISPPAPAIWSWIARSATCWPPRRTWSDSSSTVNGTAFIAFNGSWRRPWFCC